MRRIQGRADQQALARQRRAHALQEDDDANNTVPVPVDQPGVFQRELRLYLTGIITMATPRFGQQSSSELTRQQTSYNQLSLDPSNLVRILTFHDAVGGERYTGLTNNAFNREDFSHLLKLGRAILFGRVSQPLTTIDQDRQTLEPDRQTSFVRLILPVARSGELLNNLRRVVPD